MQVREAVFSDNAGLLELTRMTPMKGIIGLRIDREPDFFALLHKRGDSTVLVAEEGGKIVGVFSASKHDALVGGERVPVYYLADLKVHPSWRGSTLGIRLVREMTALLQKKGGGLVFCTMASGNDLVVPFFRERAGLPPFVAGGTFKVLQILPSPRRPVLSFQILEQAGLPALQAFYQNFFRRYQLGPLIEEHNLGECRHLICMENEVIKAAISLMDTSDLKQNVVVSLPWYLKLLSCASRLVSPLLPLPPLPRAGAPIRMWNIRYWGCLDGDAETLLSLVQAARRLAWEHKYLFLSVGLHERDPLLPKFSRLPHFVFDSLGMLTTLQWEGHWTDTVREGIPFEDFALV